MLLLLLIFVPIIGIFIILAETSFNPALAKFSSHSASPLGNRAEEEENKPAPLESKESTLDKDPQTEERGEMPSTVGLGLRPSPSKFLPGSAPENFGTILPLANRAEGSEEITLYKNQQVSPLGRGLEERGEIHGASQGFPLATHQQEKNNNGRGHKLIKLVALGASLVNLLTSLLVFTLYDFSSNSFQFVQEYHQVSYFPPLVGGGNWDYLGGALDFYLGLDGLSIYFVLLTTIIIPIALLSN